MPGEADPEHIVASNLGALVSSDAPKWVEKLAAFRVTLPFPVFDNAACVLFLACGADKAPALKPATSRTVTSDTPPAGRIRPTNGDLVWLVDVQAMA